MKALTLTQPWATLVAFGYKKIETRSWSTRYRGPVAIHAAKGFPPRWLPLHTARRIGAGYEIERDVGGVLLRHPNLSWPYRLPLGAVVAVAVLTDVVATDSPRLDLGATERRLGDYTPGRFAWVLAGVDLLIRPVPASGRLGLWDWAPPTGPPSRGSR